MVILFMFDIAKIGRFFVCTNTDCKVIAYHIYGIFCFSDFFTLILQPKIKLFYGKYCVVIVGRS